MCDWLNFFQEEIVRIRVLQSKHASDHVFKFGMQPETKAQIKA